VNDLHAVLNAQETSLADYLNQPVHDILARLGIDGAKNVPTPQDQNAGTGAADPAAASPNSFDPSAMIQPVTDALGTLGSGQFGDTDPTKALDSVSQTLDSAGQAAQQALAAAQGLWQGDAATSAAAKTTDAVADGATVSEQAANLSQSLATAAADVKQAETRLIEIITEFWATIAAIGPNIIFPWGTAAAIAAANKAITSATRCARVCGPQGATEQTRPDGAGRRRASVHPRDADHPSVPVKLRGLPAPTVEQRDVVCRTR
jgi:uncharacterized protein YukE